MGRPRIVFIGLEAADRDLVRLWGELVIALLMRDGFTASSDTPLAVLEGSMWPTFLTARVWLWHGPAPVLDGL